MAERIAKAMITLNIVHLCCQDQIAAPYSAMKQLSIKVIFNFSNFRPEQILMIDFEELILLSTYILENPKILIFCFLL